MEVQILMSEEMTPSLFCIRTKSQKEAFEKFDEKLQDFYRKFSDDSPIISNNNHNGLLVVFDGNRNRFQRAKFIGFFHDGRPEVYLIDQGYRLTVPFHHCFQIEVIMLINYYSR